MVALAAMVTFALLLSSGSASAAGGVSGQLGEPWSAPIGEGNGELLDPYFMGVDSEDGSVFVSSLTFSIEEMRIQKFSEEGEYEGTTALLPGLGYVGLAVDPKAHRFYVLEDEPGEAVASRVLAFSTIPSDSGKLEPAGVIPVPAGLISPREIIFDPSSGGLVIAAENASGQKVLQRIEVEADGSGHAGQAFVDAEIEPGDEWGVAVDSKGVTYVLHGSNTEHETTHAAMLPSGWTASSTPTPLTGFSTTVPRNLQTAAPPLFNLGSQVTVSTSAAGEDTLYWKTELNSSPFELLIEGYSVAEESRSVVLGGGGTEGTCRIQNLWSSLAVGRGGGLVVMDPGTEIFAPSEPSTQFNLIYRFGPGGEGCLAPAAAFKLEAGGSTTATAPLHSTVTFNGSPSELHGATLEATTWKVEGPEEFSVPVTGPTQTVEHQFNAEGDYTVRMAIKASSPRYGQFFAAQPERFHVGPPITEFPLHLTTSGTGTGGFECAVGSGTPGACMTEYPEGDAVTVTPKPAANSEFGGWTGDCTGTGACTVTMDAEHSVAAVFDTEKVPQAPEFALTISPTSGGSVTCNSGACASKYVKGTSVVLTAVPASGFEFAGWTGDCAGLGNCTLTMNGARSVSAEFKAVPPTNNPPTNNPPSSSNPPSSGNPPSSSPPPGGTKPGKTKKQIEAEKRQKAIAKCKKLKGKAETMCVKKANQIGKPKPKKATPKKKSKK
jgi:hypothetical protein